MITTETRREGREKVAPETSTRQILILGYLRRFPNGLTAEELTDSLYCAGLIPVLDKNYVKPRLTELRKRGLIEPCGKRMSETTGVHTAIWKVREDNNVTENV